MRINVEFDMYCGLTGEKEQQKIVTFQDGTIVTISYSCTRFVLIAEGDNRERLDNLIYGIWELCCLLDGYFYKPTKYVVDNTAQLPEQLIRLNFYKSDKKWAETGLVLRECGFALLNEEII